MDTVIARLRTNLAKIQGITLYMQAAQDITVGARLNKTQFQYTINDADRGELDYWASRFLDKLKAIPSITDVTTDQLNAGPLLDITIKREVASSYGILPFMIDNTLDDAFGQRIVSTIYTTLQQYHVILEAIRSSSLDPMRCNHGYQIIGRAAGTDLHARRYGRKGSADRDEPPGQFPSVTLLVQSGPRCRNRRCGKRHPTG